MRSDNLGWELAGALLEAHVPAFNTKNALKKYTARRKTDRGQPTRLDVVGIFELLAASGQLLDEAGKAGRKISEREIGQRLSKLPYFKSRGLEEETIRKLVAQLRRAWPAYRADRATEFQAQFIEVVAPALMATGSGSCPPTKSQTSSQ